ncbi:MAG: hypothetical protein OHK0011_01000 [Turneriella sp.]
MRGRKRLPVADDRTQAKRDANRRSYQKRGSKWSQLTEEQKKKRLEAARRWKQRNKDRRTACGYLDAKPVGYKKPKPVREVLPNPKAAPGSEAWYLALKEKHKGFEGQRLEKSIKPPVFLNADRGPKMAEARARE